ncbi:MAG: hypothetical protein R3320_08785 [Nitriliruptorales bacterium]|nr:hypothetical protein [Nitriliruptorales bacterium]
MSAGDQTSDGTVSLDQVAIEQRARVERIVAVEDDDPYPAMAENLGLTTGLVVRARGYDDERDVYLFEDEARDRRFGLPIETCRRVFVEIL